MATPRPAYDTFDFVTEEELARLGPAADLDFPNGPPPAFLHAVDQPARIPAPLASRRLVLTYMVAAIALLGILLGLGGIAFLHAYEAPVAMEVRR